MEKTGVFAVLLTLIVSLGINTAGAQEQGQAKDKDKNDALAPVIILGPPIVALDKEMAGGCWARLYTDENYLGDVLSLAGPINIPETRVGVFTWGRKYDSIIVGPKAHLVVYDDELYRDKAATFKPGQSVPDLDEKLGFFENIESLKLACTS